MRSRGKKINVFHVYKWYFPDSWGGLEQSIFQICRSTTKLNVKNSLFTLSKNPFPMLVKREETDVYRFPVNLDVASCPMSIKSLFSFKELAGMSDIIHYHFPWPFADLLNFLKPPGKPYIVTYHLDIVRQKNLLIFYRPLMRRFLSGAAKIICTSQNYLGTSAELQRLKENVEVIPFGLDQTSYPETEPDRKQKWKSMYGGGFFLFIGVLRYYKGLHILLEAAKGAKYKILIVGTGPIENELKKLVKELGLDNVHFLGFLPDEDKMALLSLSKGAVFPSHLRSEAFGISLLEAAMLGKPMISTEIGTGTSYVNINNITGLVVKPNDASELRQAMETLHAQPELAKEMGRNAKSRFDKLFSAKEMGQRYMDVYRKVLSG